MQILFVSLAMLISTLSFSQGKDEKQILSVLDQQIQSWNRGDLEGFMKPYWKSDSLMFIGKNGIKWGWNATLENYRKSYPDTTSMGKLSFNILQVKKLSGEYYFVVGKWMLKRTIGDLSGHYNLLVRKIKGKWFIIADHSS